MANRLLYLLRHGEAAEDDSLTERGREQARRTADRLAGVSFAAVHHSTTTRATETVKALAEALQGVPHYPSDLLRECVPSIPDHRFLTPAQVEFFTGLSPQVLADEGPGQAAAALARYAGTAEEDRRELVVTHGNLIRHFVAAALGAPSHAWLNLADYNCGLSVILYRPARPSVVVVYNDVGHLPPELRGTEFPAELRM
ncbi:MULTISPECIES: histidine phosphatase family protein [unclassified Crossiella]|uniref:histidine phosphatase family protein n=1 Tax=unclassified Crossiella TaxID=2620835 RepID=UPI001FFF68ED|nr:MULTISPECIES: histidine phosphatase family protein [unclassified Crossiella]MCK2236463.1 histidine phosphatase family protein [Crossiella sp. S99.2]MCK2250130.1 histidine phosphatase family protein [Crossiella sp. S99.1]